MVFVLNELLNFFIVTHVGLRGEDVVGVCVSFFFSLS